MLRCPDCGQEGLDGAVRCTNCGQFNLADNVDYAEDTDDYLPVVVSFPAGRSQRRWVHRGHCPLGCAAVELLGSDAAEVARWERKWAELAADVLKVEMDVSFSPIHVTAEMSLKKGDSGDGDVS